MSTDMSTVDSGVGLRSRSSFSKNHQSGEEDDQRVEQKLGWLRSRTSRFSKFGGKKLCIITTIIILAIVVTIITVPFDDIRLVSAQSMSMKRSIYYVLCMICVIYDMCHNM